MPFDDIGFDAPYAALQAEREKKLLAGLVALGKQHAHRCIAYRQMIAGVWEGQQIDTVEDVPYLPVRVFKYLDLKSVSDDQVIRRLTSSGTSGQLVSKIALDAETSRLQVKALSSIIQNFIGGQRLPMLILDQKATVGAKAAFSARAAGILGFSNFGHHHTYALDENMQPKWDEIESFLKIWHEKPILIFGFTYVVWQNFLIAAREQGKKLNFGAESILIHGGGWKRLTDKSVNNDQFKGLLQDQFGIGSIHNYYGMVEQVGSIFMECSQGHFHVPAFADVVMRDPISLLPASSGVVEVLSLLPHSYPGHAILTDDMGTLTGIDNCSCGRSGKTFLIHGRVPKVELRGCSDVGGI